MLISKGVEIVGTKRPTQFQALNLVYECQSIGSLVKMLRTSTLPLIRHHNYLLISGYNATSALRQMTSLLRNLELPAVCSFPAELALPLNMHRKIQGNSSLSTQIYATL